MSRPDAALVGVATAWSRLDRALGRLTDDAARAPSQLPGWTRAHVVAHVWGNAEGFVAMVTAAADGRVGVQYPGGVEGRGRDIAGRAALPLDVIVDGARASEAALTDAWDLMPADAWDQPSAFFGGTQPVAVTALARWREIVVHHVDLDAGLEPEDVPADYHDADADWLAEYRPDWTAASR
ncbi:MAG TPA: maleylpyruvate isomerase N-terminal domain-containing protein [Acidimicrobiia bacterium]|nr:maleylpyruvate isomerase N-terminal domain-containing protein [Acidimicrobiia bacterium]